MCMKWIWGNAGHGIYPSLICLLKLRSWDCELLSWRYVRFRFSRGWVLREVLVRYLPYHTCDSYQQVN